jgi:PAS domain S-box-containing protein
MQQARDIMTPNPICIPAESHVADAVNFFLQNHVSSAPVVTEKKKVLGQLSELNLMRAYVKTSVTDNTFAKIIDYKELLTPPEFVKTAATLSDVLVALIRCPLHRVLVQDGSNQLVGIISPKDVLRAMGGKGAESLVQKMRELELKVQGLTTSLNQIQTDYDQYKHVINDSSVCMHSVDRSGHILMANALMHQLLGYTDGALVGMSIYDIYPQTLHETVRASLEKIITDGSKEITYSSFVTKAKKVLRVEMISSSLKNNNGEFIGTVTVSRPIDSEQLLRSLNGIFK